MLQNDQLKIFWLTDIFLRQVFDIMNIDDEEDEEPF